MKTRSCMNLVPRILGLLALCAVISGSVELSAAAKKSTFRPKGRPIKNPKYIKSAEKVDLFKAIKDGNITARLVMKNSKEGQVLITNTTKQPLTVKLPQAVVGVHVLKQDGEEIEEEGEGGEQGGGDNNNNNNNNNNQPIGGGFGQGGFGQGGGGRFPGGGGGRFPGGGGGGGGFFSIPPEKAILIPFKSVCLAHGKREPNLRCHYRLVPVESYTKNKTLRTLIHMIATGRINSHAAQAAAWNLTNRMSWQQLAMKQQKHIGRPSTPYFRMSEVLQAQRVVAYAVKETRYQQQKAAALEKKRESESENKLKRSF